MKFTSEETRAAMVLAWVIRREEAEKFGCKPSEIVFSECLKIAYQKIKDEKIISFEQWFEFYEKNIKSFNYILYKQEILTKNGKFTISQIVESQTTSSFFQILPSDLEDIKQESILKMQEFITRKGGILWKYRYSSYGLVAKNTVRLYLLMLRRARLATNPNQIVRSGWGDDNNKIPITVEKYRYQELKMDLKKALNNRQFEIVSLLEQGYKKKEIADIIGISRQAVNDNLNKIRKIITENKLYKPGEITDRRRKK